MAQHDYVIANGTGAAVRSDINNGLAAIVSQNSGATEPATMYAYQWWADTTTGLLKIRNAANNAWVTVGTLASANLGLLSSGSTVTAALGSASTPGITFTGDTNTGIYSPGADQVAISTNGSGRLFVDSSGRVLVGTSSGRNVGIGVQVSQQIETTGSTYAGLAITSNRNDADGSYLVFGKSRGTTVGSSTVVQSGDLLGMVVFAGGDGTDVLSQAATIEGRVDGTPGADDMPGRLVFSTTADGASSPTERLRIGSAGLLYSTPTYNSTTTNAANVFIASNGEIARSTSSIKYKTDVETLADSYADAILQCRPVWYRSTTGNDNPEWGWWGFIAEEVAEIDPRLVFWKTTETSHDETGSVVETPLETPEPEGVQYDRFVPHLLNLIKRQQQAIETLEAKVAALETA